MTVLAILIFGPLILGFIIINFFTGLRYLGQIMQFVYLATQGILSLFWLVIRLISGRVSPEEMEQIHADGERADRNLQIIKERQRERKEHAAYMEKLRQKWGKDDF